MKKIKNVFILTLVIIGLVVLMGCNQKQPKTDANIIKEVIYNDNFELILKYENGNEEVIVGLGINKEVKNVILNNKGEVEVLYFDDTIRNLGNSPIYYLVQFKDYDNYVISVQKVLEGESAIAPNPPQNNNYEFIGWDRSFNVIHTNLDVNALFKEEPEKFFHLVTFKDESGKVIDVQNVLSGEGADTPEDPIREGYEFVGWDSDYSVITRDIIIKAIYIELEYTVKFESNGSDEISDLGGVTYGSTIDLPMISKWNYTFKGWYLDKGLDDPFTGNSKVYKDITLYAKWESNKYDLDFGYDGSNVTLSFWHRMGTSSHEVVSKWVKDFNDIYPNITVNVLKAGDDYDDLSDKVVTSLLKGNQPNIVEGYDRNIFRYGNFVESLDKYINHPNLGYSKAELDDFIPGIIENGSVTNNYKQVMSLPFYKSTEALFYNETYFKEHGYTIPERGYWTWDEIFDIAEDIKLREPSSIPFGYESTLNLFTTGSKQWKSPYMDFEDNGRDGKVLFNNEKSKDMVSYFKDKIDRGLMITRDLNGGSYASDNLKKGEGTYMFVGSTAGARYTVEGSDQAFSKGYRVGVNHVPVKDIDQRYQNLTGPNLSIIKNDDEQQMIASWIFMKFISGPERNLEMSINNGYLPLRYSSYETSVWEDYISKIKDNPSNTNEAGRKAIKDTMEIFRDGGNIYFSNIETKSTYLADNEVNKLINKIFRYKQYKTQSELNDYIKRSYEETYNFITGY